MKYDTRESNIFSFVKLAVNTGIVILGYYAAFFIRYGADIKSRNIEPFTALIPYIAIVSIFFFHIYLYDDNGESSYIENVTASALAIAMVQIATMAMSFFARGFAFPRSVFAISFVVQILMVLMWKKLLAAVYARYGKENRVLIVGDEAGNRKVAENVLKMHQSGITVAKEIESVKELNEGDMDGIDCICIASDVKYASRIRILATALAKDMKIFILPDLYEILLSSSRLGQFDDMPVFKVRQLSLNMEQRAAKRFLDLMLVIPGLVVASPFMVIAGMLIWKHDRGPVFYKQERLTMGGKKFDLFKFRTMVVNAEEKTGPVLAGMDDSRITGIGKFLRASRLDELPQLFNVLKGDMSLVGPRPEREYLYEKYEFKYRLSVKAGITGLGQILGKYTTSPEDKLTYDLLYEYNYSVLLDIKTILRTLRIMLKKSSSDGE